MSTWLDHWDRRYTDRVRLLVEILPVLAQETRFALKGGTAREVDPMVHVQCMKADGATEGQRCLRELESFRSDAPSAARAERTLTDTRSG